VSDNRAFHYALGASLAAHALLLFAFPDLVDTARRAASIPPQIIARLTEPEPAPAAVIPEEQPRRELQPVKKEPAKKPARVEAAPAPKPAPMLSAPQRVPEPTPPAAPPDAPPAPPLAAVEPQPAAPSASLPPSSPSALPQAPVQGESLSRDQYRLQLIDEAVRHKRYPPLARDNNWEGVVGVHVAVAPNGRPSVSVKSSSGYEVLDRQALEMFAQAARSVPVPQALRGKAFVLDLPVRYNLED
jgi:TonB family protein